MTALTVIQDGVDVLPVTTVPSTIEGSSDPDVVSLLAALNKTGRMLDARHSWNSLGRLFSFTSTGANPQQVALPSDWRKFYPRASVWRSGSNLTPLSGPCPPDVWHELLTLPGIRFPGYWRLFARNIEIIGAPSGETVSIEYVRTGWVVPTSGDNKVKATKDADTFLYPEYLLTLGTIYNWRQAKSLSYAEEMADFEHQLEMEIAADRAARPISTTWPVEPDAALKNWPGVITVSP